MDHPTCRLLPREIASPIVFDRLTGEQCPYRAGGLVLLQVGTALVTPTDGQ